METNTTVGKENKVENDPVVAEESPREVKRPDERYIHGDRYSVREGTEGFYVYDQKSLDVVKGADGKYFMTDFKRDAYAFMDTLKDDAPVVRPVPKKFASREERKV
jgi:hypothetical protein